MKIAVCSDVHLEFGDLVLENKDNADVLVLSGDILVAKELTYRQDPTGIIEKGRGDRFYEFLERCCANFPNVIYIMGNHEHYHGDFAKSANEIREATKDLINFHFLDKEVWEHGDYVFVGGTLWTTMNNNDEDTKRSVGAYMNDFQIVKNSNRMVEYNVYGADIKDVWSKSMRPATFSPTDAYEDHLAMMEVIKDTCAKYAQSKIIVCGHHAPSKSSTHPRYKDDVIVNWGYSSNLDEFILDNRNIKMWTHGHTHEPFDYMIGVCRVVCNPRGYINYEDRADQFELLTFEV
jgi:predicted phosphodiesterase